MSWFSNDDNKILELDRHRTEGERHRHLKDARDKIRTLHTTISSKLSAGKLAECVMDIREELSPLRDRNLINTIPPAVTAAYRNNALPTSVRLTGNDLKQGYERFLIAATQCVNQVLTEQQRGSTLKELQEYLNQADYYLERLEQMEVAIRQYEEELVKEKTA